MKRHCWLVVILLGGLTPFASAAEPSLRDQAAAGLRKAVDFYRTQAGVQGGYLYRYSEDLTLREGEGKASATQVWVQPPGTPSVGLAFLQAYRDTGDPYYLDAAKESGHALIRGQLRSGGWDYSIEFDPTKRARFAYRVEPTPGTMNVTTLDDNNTQESIRFLMRLDTVLDRKDAAINEATLYALDSLRKAQYPNGAWPQRFDTVPDPAKFPVRKADYPPSWPREYPKLDYRSYYTFNDDSLSDVIDVMFEAERTYGGGKYRAAALKGGDFLLLAQMPEPQPGWAQQYNAEMHPAWARKFEPPSITGGEAQGVMLTLLRIYRETGDAKYLEPLPRALAYYRKSLLPGGQLARFYELKTNKPLYFTKDYQLTFDDSNVPTHYSFTIPSKLDGIEKEVARLKKNPPPAGGEPLAIVKKSKGKPSPSLEKATREALAALDAKGRWVEDGKMKYAISDSVGRVIDTRTFLRNVRTLSTYLAASPR